MSASTIPFPLLTSHIGIYCPRNERHRNWRKYRSEATVGEFFDILRESFVCSASDRCFSAYVSLFHRALQAVIRRSHDAVGLICSPLSAFPDKSRSHCSLLIRFTRLAFQSISSISRLGSRLLDVEPPSCGRRQGRSSSALASSLSPIHEPLLWLFLNRSLPTPARSPLHLRYRLSFPVSKPDVRLGTPRNVFLNVFTCVHL